MQDLGWPSPGELDKWEIIDQIGQGGQGRVYRAISPAGRNRRGIAAVALQQAVAGVQSGEAPIKIAAALEEISLSSRPPYIGALKIFEIPAGAEGEKAVGRLSGEVEALSALRDAPGILQMLHSNVAKRFMVTQYHDAGRLSDHSGRFRGAALLALEAFRPLIQATASLHAKGIIHRDIKPDNIFVSDSGELVLGDFGIVFFKDEKAERLTETFERAKGTRDWMAPWAYTGGKIDFESIDPTFDLFPLGKVLWAMVSGKAVLPFWYHRKPAHDIEAMFPQTPEMSFVNRVLDLCIVEDKESCVTSANQLLDTVDQALARLRRGARELGAGKSNGWCRVCGLGTYELLEGSSGADRVLVVPEKKTADSTISAAAGDARYLSAFFQAGANGGITIGLYACNRCGHVDLFRWPDGQALPAWTGK